LTRGELIELVARRLAAAPLHYGHGTDNARDEAAWLVLRGIGLPFDAELSPPVTGAQERRIDRLAERRIREKIPVAYLLKEAWLAGVPFYVDERVIVPRSHIAELFPALKKRLPGSRRILDLCTGSGCLAILAAKAFPAATVDGADISPAALAVARKNVARHRLGRRVRLVRSSLFESLHGRYDLIVSNPPYVAAPAMAALPREYRHEPRLALAGGRDGLELVARIVEQAAAHLGPGGALVCEVGESHPAARRRFRALALQWPKPEVFVYAPRASR
jgi:ribosomal protein L3 glutamine methyltransferase